MDLRATVLVAEDSRTQSLRMQYLLENAGFQAIMAVNGREALEAIRRSQPDVVVTDLTMPEMDGVALVEAAHLEFPELPIVLATTAGSEALAAEALRQGAMSYVPKDFMEQLIPTLQRLLAIVQADVGVAAQSEGTNAEAAGAVELQFCLANDEALVASPVAQLRRLIQRFAIRDVGGAIRAAIVLDEVLQTAYYFGNLQLPFQLRENDSPSFERMVSQHRSQSPFKDRRIYLSARVGPNTAECIIRDEGPGCDLQLLSNPSNPVHLNGLSGRGLWLATAFMDEVRHNVQGNEFTMILRKREQGVV